MIDDVDVSSLLSLFRLDRTSENEPFYKLLSELQNYISVHETDFNIE